VDAASPQAAYTVVLSASRRLVLFADIETSRVTAEERLNELGYEPVAYPWPPQASRSSRRHARSRRACPGGRFNTKEEAVERRCDAPAP
jgi:hypothetical protein